ncbi:MAG TPA: ABC transporter permease [Candidatus Omnitrophota bacterium]|nr:ABC transporter permease [Candidatus Omnitrophota bacterium]HPD85238.1 ABC transporter permease [Candidatus Omnitrophota bacterium]HRZ04261.1 ABC transporter permease [Candidatus Omnitrophota bacterium]
MKKILIIAFKELETYFKSPLAYVVLFITIATFNVFFFILIDHNHEATLRDMFKLMEFMFVFIVPILTMKVFAEEKHTGTIEFLMTAPVTNGQITLGKYLGSLIFFSAIVAVTSIYYFIISCFGQPDSVPELVGYFGIWLEGALFIAIGILASSLTKSQIVAAIGSYIVILLLYFSMSFTKFFSGLTKIIIERLSFWSHTQNLYTGLLTLEDLVYFISGIIFCLILTRIAIENRLWK